LTIVNIELYIQSGIVESYVLGLASPGEVAEFEQLLPHFPELKDALSDFEYQLELFALDHEVPPPPGSRERIEARLRETPSVRPPIHEEKRYRRDASGDYIRVEASSGLIKVHKYWRTTFIAILSSRRSCWRWLFIISWSTDMLKSRSYRWNSKWARRAVEGAVGKINFGRSVPCD